LSAGRFRKFDKFFSSRVTDLVLHKMLGYILVVVAVVVIIIIIIIIKNVLI